MADDKVFPACNVVNTPAGGTTGGNMADDNGVPHDELMKKYMDMMEKRLNNGGNTNSGHMPQTGTNSGMSGEMQVRQNQNQNQSGQQPYSGSECICGCVGYGYVPWQVMNNTFDAAEALANGTVFPELALTIKEYGNVCKQTGGVQG